MGRLPHRSTTRGERHEAQGQYGPRRAVQTGGKSDQLGRVAGRGHFHLVALQRHLPHRAGAGHQVALAAVGFKNQRHVFQLLQRHHVLVAAVAQGEFHLGAVHFLGGQAAAAVGVFDLLADLAIHLEASVALAALFLAIERAVYHAGHACPGFIVGGSTTLI